MTTNQERAEELMANARKVVSFKQLAQALADAGLITPDLPKVVWPGSSLVVSGESETLSVETEESEGPRGATQEVEYRIVPTDHNGGKYQTRKWTRMVTEWQPDE